MLGHNFLIFIYFEIFPNFLCDTFCHPLSNENSAEEGQLLHHAGSWRNMFKGLDGKNYPLRILSPAKLSPGKKKKYSQINEDCMAIKDAVPGLRHILSPESPCLRCYYSSTHLLIF